MSDLLKRFKVRHRMDFYATVSSQRMLLVRGSL